MHHLDMAFMCFDALVSKDTIGLTTCFQALEEDKPCDKNHINQHRDTSYAWDLIQHRGTGKGNLDVTSQDTSHG